jgi:hypothetical protein
MPLFARNIGFSLLAPAAAIAAVTTPSVIWIWVDRSVFEWDQAWYGEVSLDLWHARQDGARAWMSGMLHAFGAKPPLLAWTAQFFVPLTGITGDVERALLALNLCAAAATLALVYAISWRVTKNAASSIAAVLVCGGAPLFVGLIHEFMVEIVQCFTVALMMTVAWRAEHRSLVRTAALVILALALGVLVKASSPLFAAPLIGYIAIAWLVGGRERPGMTAADIFFALAAAVGASLAAAWYVVNWAPMLAHIQSSVGAEAVVYGSPGDMLKKLSFWLNATALAVSPFWWIGIGMLVLAITRLARGVLASLRGSFEASLAAAIENGTLFAMALGGTVVLVWISYSLQPNEDTRFLAPVLPMIAVLMGWSLSGLGRVAGMSASLLAANAAVNNVYAFGWNPLQVAESPWLKAVHASDDDRGRLRDAVRVSCPPQERNRYVIVGVEYPAFNANSAAFYSAQRRLRTGYRCYYTSLGYLESDAERAFARIFMMNAVSVVTIPPALQQEGDNSPFNKVSRVVAERLLDDRRFSLVAGAPADTIVLARESGSP